jgi:hypothetical protein
VIVASSLWTKTNISLSQKNEKRGWERKGGKGEGRNWREGERSRWNVREKGLEREGGRWYREGRREMIKIGRERKREKVRLEEGWGRDAEGGRKEK